MKPVYVGLVALALLAATAGFVMHQHLSRVELQRREALSSTPAGAQPTVEPAAPAAVFDWSFADLAGKSQPLAQWRGQLVVLNFWATWCPPCLKEIPAFVDLQQRLGARGLQFVGIALDQVEAVKPFVADHGLNYPILFGDQDVARMMTSLGNQIGGLPYTVVVGRDGKVLTVHQGEWPADEAAKSLEAALSQP